MKVYAKNSFDRFGDDLTEEILQYLTFEDKVRLECVSKQWRRLVFNKQYVIKIKLNSYDKNSINRVLDKRRRLNVQILESVLKKCPHIIRVDLHLSVNSSVLSLIGRYCPNIKSLRYEYSKDDKYVLDFFRMYGHKLEELTLIREHYSYIFLTNKVKDSELLTSYLKYCPNLKITWFPITLVPIIEDKDYLPKLKTINNLMINFNDVNKMKILSDKYSKTMKTLDVILYRLTLEELKTCFESISRFENLQSLTLKLRYYETIEPIDDSLILIGQKCNRLLKFSYQHWAINSVKCVESDKVFSQFKAIEVLNISLSFNTEWNGSIEALKHCKQLIKLDICNPELTEDFFTNIEIFVPKLRILRIETRKQFSDSFINYFNSMKNLQKVEIHVINGEFEIIQRKYWYFGKSVSEVMLSPNGMNVKHITHNCGLIAFNQ